MTNGASRQESLEIEMKEASDHENSRDHIQASESKQEKKRRPDVKYVDREREQPDFLS